MTGWELWNRGIGYLNVCAVYYGLQLVRCMLLSVLVFALILLLRKTALKRNVFLKGALWSLLIPVLFAGRMRFFYETRTGVFLFSWCSHICMEHVWFCWLYLGGVLVLGIRMVRKRRRLRSMLAGLEKTEAGGVTVYAAGMPVSPFAAGLLRPRIILPRIILHSYDSSELRMIVLHEQMHIRLGHLWFYLIWDVLGVLLWMNPLFAASFGARCFREDLEEICDLATIQQSEGSAYAYGRLLIKSMKLLQMQGNGSFASAAFAQEKEYVQISRRLTRIARYQPYKRAAAAGIFAGAALCVIAQIAWIQSNSYDRYNEDDSIWVYTWEQDGDTQMLASDDSLRRMISYDDHYVYVKKQAFEQLLCAKKARGDVYIVFGGFYKLPGLAGFGYSCCYETEAAGDVARIPYDRQEDDWVLDIVKRL